MLFASFFLFLNKFLNVNLKSFFVPLFSDHFASNSFIKSSALISKIFLLKLYKERCCDLTISFSLSKSLSDFNIEKSNGAIIVS